ncbi:hypothetical protein ELH80_33605 [Rhizobium ruizarguesonis]|jgi:hypothetical protein|uniref:Uncharacterized protein n=1 Tax=Rhizobium ruizarguesonis TaxID=2081791 RepID=A0AAE8Q779_9HYPH|nr:hypothetical protein [Rhizobium ruizarguesonis]TAY70474.1 hypothetical protein ELH86_30870 [Rhizobium ruizarguesonis]TAZ24855.1 hypothetical protein ELH80_33605 [Rhizobium ruizarguesonis]TBA56357.1 hypothetical protein ELH58_32535 [Rhizobium ruizarguesonis]TBB19333.1 hypothetical protein ELH47_34070 [Rhizobium ruizarguesonis]TBF05589.1 hypothetical protein ELG94_33585 [Rhizobium ruizarguesonis]
MPIVREVALWIAGIAAFFCLGGALGSFADKLVANSSRTLAEPLIMGFPFLFVCIRLWVLDRRAVQKSLADR